MKIEKFTFTVAVVAMILAVTHNSAANTNTVSANKTTAPKKAAVKKPATKKSATKKTVANTKTTTNTAKKASPKKATKKQLTARQREEIALDREFRAMELAALSQQPKSTARVSTTTVAPKSLIQTTTATTATAAGNDNDVFTGNVDFTMGSDSNIDPDKTGFEGTYFQLSPTLNFKSGNWGGSFGANIKDYLDTTNSELFKTNEGKFDVNYKTKLSDMTTSTSAFSYLYHDERWPDYINGEYDFEGNRASMPIRYSNFSVSQTLDFDTGKLKTQIGGSATHRDFYNGYTDFADVVLGELEHQRDYNELAAFGRISVEAASFLELAASPKIKQIRFNEREARQPDGPAGGDRANAPLFQLMTTEIGFDMAFKFGDSNITPNASIGMVSDEGLGAEDNSFYSVGIKSAVVLDKTTSLTLSPNVNYRKVNFDNWTLGVKPENAKRIDDATSAGIDASIKLAKNFGLKLGYKIVRENSNWTATYLNYKQEVISSGINFSF